MNITVAEVLEALTKAQIAPSPDIPPNTYSSTEIRHAMRMGKERFPVFMRPLIESGAVAVVKVRKPAIDGRLMVTTAYQFR